MAKRANGEGTICKRSDGLWTAAITIGRDEKTGKLIRKYVYGKTKTEVQEKKAALLETNKGLSYIDADKITVAQWLEKWLHVYARTRVRQNTLEGYQFIVTNHVVPAVGTTKLSKLQATQIQAMINNILDNGGSPRLAEFSFAVLRAAIRQALKEELIYRDPTLAVSLPKKKKKEVVPLTDEQWTALLATAAKPTFIFWYPALLLEWGTGIRRGELVGLRWSDIDFKRQTIFICRAAITTKDGPKISEPKSQKSRRAIPIPATVVTELKKHKARQAAMRLKAKTWEDNDLVFPTRFGTLQDPCVVTRRFSRLVKAAGIPHISFHDLRHDHASRLFAQGEHPRDVQDRLGHSSITLTMDTYTHAMPGRQENIAGRLEENLPSCLAPATPTTRKFKIKKISMHQLTTTTGNSK